MQRSKEREIMTTAIGNQIKRKREEEGKSQRKMAEELGVAQSALSQLENGKPASLNIEKIEFICDYLEIEHTKKKLQEVKDGVLEEAIKSEKPTKPEPLATTVETKPIKNNSSNGTIEEILKKLQRKYTENMDLATKYLSEANVYADVIEMIKGVNK